MGVVLSNQAMNLEFLTKGNGVENFLTWIVIFLVFLWIVSIIRTAKDVSARTNSTILQVVSIILVTLFTPFIWLPLYLIIRPIWYKWDQIPWREACATSLTTCYNCNTLNPRDYVYCIDCWEQLKITCKECQTQYPHNYQYCNHCWAPNIE